MGWLSRLTSGVKVISSYRGLRPEEFSSAIKIVIRRPWQEVQYDIAAASIT
jgi:hypothetical protein